MANSTSNTSAQAVEGHRRLAFECCDCPLCGGHDRQSTAYRTDDVAVVRCANCRTWYLSPRPTAESIHAVYAQGDYFEGSGAGYDAYRSQAGTLKATFRAFLQQLARRGMTGGSLLEVGCGYGYLLEEAEAYFDARVGCDMSAEAIGHLQCRVRGYVGGAEAVSADERFHCIIATHVIEHIHDPVPFTQQLAARLHPGGWLILAAPDMGSLWRLVMQRRWPSFKFPEHVVFYDRTSLARLFQAAGLTSVQRVPYPHAFPLSLVCEKLGLPSGNWLKSIPVWLPATTVAFAGQADESGGTNG